MCRGPLILRSPSYLLLYGSLDSPYLSKRLRRFPPPRPIPDQRETVGVFVASFTPFAPSRQKGGEGHPVENPPDLPSKGGLILYRVVISTQQWIPPLLSVVLRIQLFPLLPLFVQAPHLLHLFFR